MRATSSTRIAGVSDNVRLFLESNGLEEDTSAEAAAVVARPQIIKVKRILIDGKQYLKTAENVLYDPVTREEVGIYEVATNKILPMPEEEEEEESDEDDSDDDDDSA